MSDGNFNRALLPSTPYASGVKTGKAQARVKAEQAFEEWLREDAPSLTEAEVNGKVASFKRLLAAKL